MLFRTWCFYCCAPGSGPNRGTRIPQASRYSRKKKKKGKKGSWEGASENWADRPGPLFLGTWETILLGRLPCSGQNPRLVLVKRLGAKVSSGLEYLNVDSNPSNRAHPCEDRPRSTVGLELLSADSSPSSPAHPREDRPRSTMER